MKYVHSIKQPNDTTLWVSTVGEGIVKVIFDASTATPTVKSASRTVIDNGRMASNYFFTSYQENDSILWFGNSWLRCIPHECRDRGNDSASF